MPKESKSNLENVSFYTVQNVCDRYIKCMVNACIHRSALCCIHVLYTCVQLRLCDESRGGHVLYIEGGPCCAAGAACMKLGAGLRLGHVLLTTRLLFQSLTFF